MTDKTFNLGNDPGAQIRKTWKMLSRVPGGKRLFSAMIGRAARYTGSIGAQVVALEGRRAEVVLRDRPAVRNHLRCVHAIALANLAELTGNVAIANSLPPGSRFIVAGFDIEYLKKARGNITGHTECPEIPDAQRKEYLVTVSMRDTAGDEVARCTLRTLVGPTKGATLEEQTSASV